MHWRRKWQPTPVFLPGESQGQRAWWAAVYGVAQSQIRLKQLSSSRVSSLEKAMAPYASTLVWKIPMDGGAWKAAVHGVAEGWTRLSGFTFTFHFHALEKEKATHSSGLAWRIQGWGSLVGCRL